MHAWMSKALASHSDMSWAEECRRHAMQYMLSCTCLQSAGGGGEVRENVASLSARLLPSVRLRAVRAVRPASSPDTCLINRQQFRARKRASAAPAPHRLLF